MLSLCVYISLDMQGVDISVDISVDIIYLAMHLLARPATFSSSPSCLARLHIQWYSASSAWPPLLSAGT